MTDHGQTCPNCGAIIEFAGAKFCTTCGAETLSPPRGGAASKMGPLSGLSSRGGPPPWGGGSASTGTSAEKKSRPKTAFDPLALSVQEHRVGTTKTDVAGKPEITVAPGGEEAIVEAAWMDASEADSEAAEAAEAADAAVAVEATPTVAEPAAEMPEANSKQEALIPQPVDSNEDDKSTDQERTTQMADKAEKCTLVEEGTKFKGSFESTCPVLVRGRVEGEMETPSLTVSATGAVHGKVNAGKIQSEGELSGEFDADAIELAGAVKDNTVIRARSLKVELSAQQGKMQIMFAECEAKGAETSALPGIARRDGNGNGHNQSPKRFSEPPLA